MCEPGRSQSPHGTAAARARKGRPARGRESISPSQGRGVGRGTRDDRNGATERRKCRRGYARRRGATRLFVGRSRGLDETHAVGAGQLKAIAKQSSGRQRRQVVRVDGQGVRAQHAGGGMDESPGQPRRGGLGRMLRIRLGMGRASSGSRLGRTSIWPSCRRRCGRARTARKPSNGSTSRRAMARRGRWASRRSRIASSSRRCGW